MRKCSRGLFCKDRVSLRVVGQHSGPIRHLIRNVHVWMWTRDMGYGRPSQVLVGRVGHPVGPEGGFVAPHPLDFIFLASTSTVLTIVEIAYPRGGAGATATMRYVLLQMSA